MKNENPSCSIEGSLYEYYNVDPYEEFRTASYSEAGPYLTMLNNEGYTYIINHKSYFSGIWDVYSYCKANKLLADTGVSMTRSLEEVDSTSANYFKGITMRGEFDQTDCPGYLEYAVIPCFSIGEDQTGTSLLSGKVTYNNTGEGHVESMRAGLPVYFTYSEGRDQKILSAKTDKNGNFSIANVPFGITGTLSFQNMGYYDEKDINISEEKQSINLEAKGPYLEYYTWDSLREIADQFTDGSILTDDALKEEFENYAENGDTKEVYIRNGSTIIDLLNVRIIGFNADYKSNISDNNTAGMTFMAVNSLNSIQPYTDIVTTRTSYSTSIIKKALNDGGEIYNGLPEELKNNIVPVVKASAYGWEGISYYADLEYSLDKMFLPSLSELGANGPEIVNAGNKYEYIANDPYRVFT